MHQDEAQQHPQKVPTEDSNSPYGNSILGCEKSAPVLFLAYKSSPQRFGYSAMMTAIVGAIIGYDYGVRDPLGGKLTGISITSDGFIIASTTSHESGAFIGTAINYNSALF